MENKLTYEALEQRLQQVEHLLKSREATEQELLRLKDAAFEESQRQYTADLTASEISQAQKIEAIGTLAKSIANDLNNQLTVFMGYIQLALSGDPGMNAAILQDKIDTTYQQMAHKISQLHSFDRRESKKHSEVSLQQVVEQMKTTLYYTFPEDIELNVELPDDPLTLYATESMFQEILLNLCTNAVEAMPEGGELTIRCNRMQRSDGEYIQLAIQDTGIGMTPEEQEHIFDPFYTGHSAEDATAGLGLSVVKHHVKELHGLIEIDSQLNQGTTFCLSFPVTAIDIVRPTESLERQTDSFAGRESLLVVDDEPGVRELASVMLEQLGYTVFAASDGPRAIEIYKENAPQIALVILDISMPHMDGKTCLKELRSFDPDVCVLFSSGTDMLSEARELMAIGAKGILQKPYRLEEMARQIREVLQ